MRDNKKKKRKVADSTTCGFTNVQANVDAFNHNVSGAGSIPGTGVGMCESIGDNLPFEDWADVNSIEELTNALKKDGWVMWHKSEAELAGICFYFFKNNKVDDYFIEAYVADGKCKACKVQYENEEEEPTERYEKLRTKSVMDADGFLTDYTMYFDHEMNKYVFVFGDNELYSPEDGYFDWECDTEEEANDWFDGYEGFDDDDDDNEFVEDNIMTEEVSSELPDLAEENIIAQEDAGISSLFIDTINDCWNMIDNYHSIIVTLDSLDRHEFDETLQGLLEERNREVGALQGILEMLSPASAQIEQGKEEAQDEISFDQVEEDFGLNESWEIFYGGKSLGKFEDEDENPYDYTNRINSMYERVKKKYPDLSDDELGEELRFELKDMFHGMRFEIGNDTVIDSIVKKLLNNGKVNSVYGVESVRSIPRGISLKESWNSNGKLEDFVPEDLIKKAFDNKYSTYSVRDFGGKQLYINIDPDFLFGVRDENAEIWINIVQIDGEKQNRIYLDSANSFEEAVDKLNSWKDEYIRKEGKNKDEETSQEDEKELQ